MIRPVALSLALAAACFGSVALAQSVAAPATAAAVPSAQEQHAKAELVAETTALLRGGDSTVALRLTPEPGWHTYWINPGDSGLATKLDWTLPEGVSAGAIQWPAPHAAPLGELTNYGYDRATLHLVGLTVPAAWPADQPLALKARAKWLACKDVCIPGTAELSLTLPVADAITPDPAVAKEFEAARSELPEALPEGSHAAFQVSDGAVSIEIKTPPKVGELSELAFFPLAGDLVNHAAPQRLAASAEAWRLTQTLSAYFVKAPETVEGVWVATTADSVRHAFSMSAAPGTVATVAAGDAVSAPAAAATQETPPAANDTSLGLALLFAFVGGLILNLMPCVFPVLSLKALSLLRSAHEHRRNQRAQAFAYTAGAVLSCVAAAVAVLALRAGGQALGWGFQLQSPVMVAVLAWLMLALGLSMSGLVEFGGRLMNAGNTLATREGLSGSFFTGVLAVVVASPCTAPFMGTALGYAITQPVAVALAVFAALGLGLASPFLLLGFLPGLARLLPRPGAWMLTFKQLMAFPLYLTAAWLCWVLTRQAGPDALGLTLGGAVLVSFALWLWGRPQRGGGSVVVAIVAVLLALALLFSPMFKPLEKGAATAPAGKEAWSTARVAALRAEGKTIFVDFTADWCITCKVNERGALKSDAVQKAFADAGVVSLVADWTQNDPAITAELSRFGRIGVPLYLLYVKGAEPLVLPQVLTPGVFTDALKP